MQKADAPKQGLQTKHIILILGIVVVIAAAAVAVILLTRDKPPEVVVSGNSYDIPIIDANNVEEISALVGEKVAAGMFTTYMSTTWIFPDGKSPASDATMGNDPSNNYPFWFTLTVNGEEVMKSSLLPVGQIMKEIKLDKDLDAGTYAAVLTVNMVDNDGVPMKTDVGFNLTLIVEN
ncbi:MAG: hypothetical protein LBN97_00600 [Oscillospiraceae bacterium]|nr:hypothetical protein [Oscillospiraceae bacterium]